MDYVIASLLLVNLVVVVLGLLWAMRVVSDVSAGVSGLLIADGDKPAPAMSAISAVAGAVAAQVRESLSAAMMGHASAASKQLAAMEGDVTEAAIAQSNPMLAALLSFSPALRKRVARNPMAAMALQSLDLGKLLGGGGGGKTGNNHHPAAGSGVGLGVP